VRRYLGWPNDEAVGGKSSESSATQQRDGRERIPEGTAGKVSVKNGKWNKAAGDTKTNPLDQCLQVGQDRASGEFAGKEGCHIAQTKKCYECSTWRWGGKCETKKERESKARGRDRRLVKCRDNIERQTRQTERKREKTQVGRRWSQGRA